jgi:hypothetical protein
MTSVTSGGVGVTAIAPFDELPLPLRRLLEEFSLDAEIISPQYDKKQNDTTRTIFQKV